MASKLQNMTLTQIASEEMEHDAILWIADGLAEGRNDVMNSGDPGWDEVTSIIADLRRVADRLKNWQGIS